MPVPPRTRLISFHAALCALFVVAGVVGSVVSYRAGRAEELGRAEAEFIHRATVRQNLARQILGRYEDSLFGLAGLFLQDGEVTAAEFEQAVLRLAPRITGAQAFEWVPAVPHRDRAAAEGVLAAHADARVTELREFDAAGQARRAADRPEYYPILFVRPLHGNEPVLGYDLKSGPTLAFLEQARATRQTIVTSQFRLRQEKTEAYGVVMILPVFRPGPPAAPAGEFRGFVQCVFRVHDLFETVRAPETDTVLDVLFLDASESDPAKRVLFHRLAGKHAPGTPAPTEAEFRRGLHHEAPLPFGQRNWRVLYRPDAAWLEGWQTGLPLVRSASVLLLSGLLAGMIYLVGRQNERIKREVAERTAELTESRSQLASLLHALPGMAYRCTYGDQLNVLFVSEGAKQLTGWTAAELINGTTHFREIIHPADLTRVRDATKEALGRHTDVEVEYRIRTRDGTEKWVLSRGRGVYSGDGRLSIFDGLAIDVTAQKRAENERVDLERKLRESQKLESLGLLAGGIAHDFNNLLSAILGNANMARLAVAGLNPRIDEHLQAIETASERAAELCRQMLAYAGKGRFVVEPVDLTALTGELMPLLRISIGRQARLQLTLDRQLPAVLADAAQLRQIIMNLVINAAEAIGERGGEITVTTGVAPVDAAALAGCAAGTDLPPGEYVFLEVRDTGCGMTPDVLAKIFDPFFTTKFTGRGLGLAAVLGIVRSHAGALQVASEPGAGTRFRLLLPRSAQPAPDRPPPPATTDGRWRHPGTVLLVDDEEHVRVVVEETLRSFGFTVRSFASGADAVEEFRLQPEAFDLVVLDLLMPGLSGEQTLLALRGLRPGVRALFISGYSEGDVLRRLGGAGPLGFIAKPFKRAALEKKLRELLGA